MASEAPNERILDFESVPSIDVTSDDEGPDEKHFCKNTVCVSSDQSGSEAVETGSDVEEVHCKSTKFVPLIISLILIVFKLFIHFF